MSFLDIKFFQGFKLAHHGAVNDACFSPSETRIASAGGDSLIKLWDIADGSLAFTLRNHTASVTCVVFSSVDELCLISASEDRQIFLWDLASKTVTKKLRGHVDVIYG